MSDHIALLVILAGLHVMESCQIAPPGSVVFRSRWWGGYIAARAADLMRVRRGRFVFLNPLQPHARFFASGLPHILPTAAGVLDVSPEEDNAPHRRPMVPWAEIGPARANADEMVCPGLGRIPCGSGANARLWARALDAIRSAPADRRARLVERWMRIRFSTMIASRRAGRVHAATRTLGLVSGLAFLVLIAGAIVVSQRISDLILLGFLGAGVAAGVAIATTSLIAQARLREDTWPARLGRALMMIACFPIAFRARSRVGRDALATLHPTATAAALLARPQAQAFLAESLRRWQHRRAEPAPATADARELQQAATLVQSLILDAAAQVGLNQAGLQTRPRIDDPAVRSTCPRCLATFTHESGSCSDCLDVPLVTTATSPDQRSRSSVSSVAD